MGTPIDTVPDYRFVHGCRIDSHACNNADDRVADVTRTTIVTTSSTHKPGALRLFVKNIDNLIRVTFIQLVH